MSGLERIDQRGAPLAVLHIARHLHLNIIYKIYVFMFLNFDACYHINGLKRMFPAIRVRANNTKVADTIPGTVIL